MQKNYSDIVKDVIVYEKYLIKNNIKLIAQGKRKILTPKEKNEAILEMEKAWQKAHFQKEGNERFDKALRKGLKFVEPLAEEGLIPANPIIKKYNEKRHIGQKNEC